MKTLSVLLLALLILCVVTSTEGKGSKHPKAAARKKISEVLYTMPAIGSSYGVEEEEVEEGEETEEAETEEAETEEGEGEIIYGYGPVVYGDVQPDDHIWTHPAWDTKQKPAIGEDYYGLPDNSYDPVIGSNLATGYELQSEPLRKQKKVAKGVQNGVAYAQKTYNYVDAYDEGVPAYAQPAYGQPYYEVENDYEAPDYEALDYEAPEYEPQDNTGYGQPYYSQEDEEEEEEEEEEAEEEEEEEEEEEGAEEEEEEEAEEDEEEEFANYENTYDDRKPANAQPAYGAPFYAPDYTEDEYY